MITVNHIINKVVLFIVFSGYNYVNKDSNSWTFLSLVFWGRFFAAVDNIFWEEEAENGSFDKEGCRPLHYPNRKIFLF